MASKKTPAFEDKLSTLESLVERLESGQLSLDEAMDAFEQGIKLTRDCQESLATAEQKVQILMTKSGQQTLQPLPEQGRE
ncbi:MULTISPECIES: exodeoxyribonuclease VII small subunit [Reinekea]|jgi:exodeoxyribonuclease VII small subunit|uniref:Exodeoxyribonuclease 7 small subunit n=1 Tax=Reinekea forsetii TaxID=1336806 RepID=A0A2K8KT73_9GAMM|nr:MULTISPECIES: exodeoxyribonuclease VII small subunit [Reinekea]ATX77927.1 exodeoxyribonuclease VII small subunit [Reinekea forsetii]